MIIKYIIASFLACTLVGFTVKSHAASDRCGPGGDVRHYTNRDYFAGLPVFFPSPFDEIGQCEKNSTGENCALYRQYLDCEYKKALCSTFRDERRHNAALTTEDKVNIERTLGDNCRGLF